MRAVASGAAGEGRRLREVGFVPGTTVRVERRAPLGDPTVYQVRATRFALRRAGADLIDVDPVDSSLGLSDTGDTRATQSAPQTGTDTGTNTGAGTNTGTGTNTSRATR